MVGYPISDMVVKPMQSESRLVRCDQVVIVEYSIMMATFLPSMSCSWNVEHVL
jgi:hypothetical protein